MKKLKELLHNYINTPLDPYANIELGLEYEKLGHGAAALSFFLRTAELIHEENPEVAYCCIIKNWKQLNNTTRRPNEEKSQLETAIAFLPKRPEAYYHLSTLYNKEKLWKKAYMYACLGLEFINNTPLPYDIEYPGDHMLLFQKALSLWYIGQRKESAELFQQLSGMSNISEYHMKIIQQNMVYLNVIHTKKDTNEKLTSTKKSINDNHVFDWGPCEINLEFKKILTQEILIDKVYEIYFPVEKNDIVVDLGSNIGLWSYTIAEKNPKHIYALEPEIECFETTRNNLNHIPNTTIINKAIANKTGSKISKDTMDCYGNKSISCPTINLKDFVNQYNLKTIDFLKVDCEGGEYEVFNNENYEWITNNVSKIAGEFHFADHSDKHNFMKFRELYLPRYKTNWKVLTMYLEDISHEVWEGNFEKYLSDRNFITFNLYIDNR